MDSIDSSDDLELIAAFIDGRLTGDDRARAVKLLAESDEALELFTNSLRDQQNVSAPNVIPLSSVRSRRRWRVVAPIAAAAALAIVAIPTLYRHGAQNQSASSFTAVVVDDAGFAGALRPGWDQRWSMTRGDDTPVVVRTASPQENRLAFRLGVRSLDLQIALSHGDTALATRLAGEMVTNLKGIGFSDLVGTSYGDLKTRIATDNREQLLERATRAEHDLRELLGTSVQPVYTLGQWSAAAELAAEARNAAFFASKGSMSVLGAAAGGSGEDAPTLRAVDTRVKQGLTGAGFDEVRDSLQSLIRRRGG